MEDSRDSVAAQDLKEVLQDQTDLLGKAQGRVRILEAALVAKDAKHKLEADGLRAEVTATANRLAEVATGKGVVTTEEYTRISEANAKLVLKLDATRKYAEEQRRKLTAPRPKLATRAEVYAALDSERRYQDARWNRDTTSTGGFHENLADWLLFQRQYLTKAEDLIGTLPEPEATRLALHMQRKVTALGVAAMEQLGAPMRPVEEFPESSRKAEAGVRPSPVVQ